jgi:hypothetical protein
VAAKASLRVGFEAVQAAPDVANVEVAGAWLDGEHPNAPKRVAPGSLPNSAVYQRFIKKGEAWSMPPLGTEVVDPTAKQLMEDWIAAAQP